MYGVDGETHVFVAAQHYTARNMFTGEDVDTWWMLQRKVRGDFRTVAPKVIRDLYGEFPHELKKGYGAKVNMLPEGTKFTEKVDHIMLKSIAFKDAVGLLGLVGEDDPWRNQKRDIRIEIVYGKMGETDPVVLTVNGREFKLSPETSKALDKKGVLKAIWGTYYSPGSHKVITKMRGGGKPILKALAAVVTSPPELKEILESAAAADAACEWCASPSGFYFPSSGPRVLRLSRVPQLLAWFVFLKPTWRSSWPSRGSASASMTTSLSLRSTVSPSSLTPTEGSSTRAPTRRRLTSST
jgi:hypothetical protein